MLTRDAMSGVLRAIPADLKRGLLQAVEAMRLGVTLTDLEGCIVYTNLAEAEMHGYDVAELIGRDATLFAPSDRGRRLSDEELSAAAPWLREGINIRKDGTRFPVRLHSDIVRDESGEPIGIITTCEDISERVQREHALRASEARYRLYLDRAVHGISRLSPEGRFLEVNPALVEMLDYESEVDVLALAVPHDVCADPAAWDGLVAGLRDGKPRSGLEMKWRRRDGTLIDVRLSGTGVLDEHGALRHLEVFAEDVTEHEALKAQLRQSQKMELLGQWTGGIAHDFNNILTVILTNGEILSDVLESGRERLENDFPDLLRELRNAARRGSAIVRKLLSFGRQRRVTLEPVNLSRVVDDLLATLRRLIPETIEIEIDNEGELPQVRADPGVVEQILLNLATNARDAMLEGGWLSIRTHCEAIAEEHRVTRGWGDPGEYACVSVSDTGTGMDAKTLSRVFEPFFTTKEPGAGTGLGMAMVYGLMKQHRGFVDVQSTVGEGTTVTVYFPVAEHAGQPDFPPEPPSRAFGGTETVLFVEDEAPIRRATKRFLEQLGYRVILATDGAEAWRILRDGGGSIDAVVTDLLMPRMTGADLYEQAIRAGLDTTFIFVSGYTKESAKIRDALRDGVPFLDKPWVPSELVAMLRRALDADESATG